jgi:hypothetical protein
VKTWRWLRGKAALTGDYWVYEDAVTRTATVHRGDCRYCNNGTGMGLGRNDQENWWLGPYESASQAQAADLKSGAVLRVCGASPCRDDPALATLG